MKKLALIPGLLLIFAACAHSSKGPMAMTTNVNTMPPMNLPMRAPSEFYLRP